MRSEFPTAQVDHALSQVKAVSEHDVDESRSVALEGSLEELFTGRKLFPLIGAGFQIDDRCMSPKDLKNFIPEHAGEDSPKRGVAGDHVPRGAQPLTNSLLATEEINLVEALTPEREASDQE